MALSSDLRGAIPAKSLELHMARSPRADGTHAHKRIQTKCHSIKPAICSDNVFKTAKWSLSGAEGTLEAMSLVRCTFSEHFMEVPMYAIQETLHAAGWLHPKYSRIACSCK